MALTDASDWGDSAREAGKMARTLAALSDWLASMGMAEDAATAAEWGAQLSDLCVYGTIMERATHEGVATRGGDA